MKLKVIISVLSFLMFSLHISAMETDLLFVSSKPGVKAHNIAVFNAATAMPEGTSARANLVYGCYWDLYKKSWISKLDKELAFQDEMRKFKETHNDWDKEKYLEILMKDAQASVKLLEATRDAVFESEGLPKIVSAMFSMSEIAANPKGWNNAIDDVMCRKRQYDANPKAKAMNTLVFETERYRDNLNTMLYIIKNGRKEKYGQQFLDSSRYNRDRALDEAKRALER